MTKLLFAAIAMTFAASSIAQETQPAVRADTVPGPNNVIVAPADVQPATQPTAVTPAPVAVPAVQQLQQENARLQAELNRLRNSPPPAAAPTPVQQPAVRADPVPGYAPVIQMAGYVTIREVDISDSRVDGHPALKVRTDVSFRDVPGLPFTLQVMLVGADEAVHTDPLSRPYVVSRSISTGRRVDTDAYTLKLDIDRLFSSQPPADAFVQVRVTTPDGAIVSKSQLYTFRKP